MKSLVALVMGVSLVAAGQWEASCTNETIPTGTHDLAAVCNDGDGKGTLVAAKLDLSPCFSYDPDTHVITGSMSRTGNLNAYCSSCYVYRVLDPIYGKCCDITQVQMNCTCAGQTTEVLATTDMYITNKFGKLTCGWDTP